jgi:hypothetical protein
MQIKRKLKTSGIDTDHMIYELLTKSVGTKEAAHNLAWWFRDGDFDVRESNDKIYVDLKISRPLSKSTIQHIQEHINALGWYISGQLKNGKWEKFDANKFIEEQRQIFTLQLEANYPTEQYDSYKILYHVSPSINREKIEHIGLCPKNKEKISKHPARIYFVFDKGKVRNIVKSIVRRTKKNIPYDVWELDASMLYDYNQYVRYFKDVNYNGGVFTLSNIPAECLKLIDTIQLTD